MSHRCIWRFEPCRTQFNGVWSLKRCSSLHFTSLWQGLWRELSFSRIVTLCPILVPAECYPWKVILPPGDDAVCPLPDTALMCPCVVALAQWSSLTPSYYPPGCCGLVEKVHRNFNLDRPARVPQPGKEKKPQSVRRPWNTERAPMLSSAKTVSTLAHPLGKV